MTESGQPAKTRLHKTQEFKVGVALAAVGGVIALFVTPAGAWLSNKVVPPNNPGPTPLVTASADPTPTASETPPAPTTTPPSETPVGAQPARVQYLSELEPKGDADNRGGDDSTVQMRNRSYESIVFSLNTFNGGWKQATYVIPDGYKFFDATIGLDDASEDDVHAKFRLKIDGNIVGNQPTLGSGQLKKIHVPLPDGAYTIGLFAEGVGDVKGVGGVGGAVWGDARFCQTSTCE